MIEKVLITNKCMVKYNCEYRVTIVIRMNENYPELIKLNLDIY
jgi:hypothetical protein